MNVKDVTFAFSTSLEATFWSAHVNEQSGAQKHADDLNALFGMPACSALGITAQAAQRPLDKVELSRAGAPLILMWNPAGSWWCTPSECAAGPVAKEVGSFVP